MRRANQDAGILDGGQQGKHELGGGVWIGFAGIPAFVPIRQRRLIPMVPIGDEQGALGKCGGHALVPRGIGNAKQAMNAPHVVGFRRFNGDRRGVRDEVAKRSVRVAIEEIERAQVGAHRAQATQPLLPGSRGRPLVRQDDALLPIAQAHASEDAGPRDPGISV